MGRIKHLAAKYGYVSIGKHHSILPKELERRAEQNKKALAQTLDELLDDGPVFMRELAKELGPIYNYLNKIVRESPSLKQITVEEALKSNFGPEVEIEIKSLFPKKRSKIIYKSKQELNCFIQERFRLKKASYVYSSRA